jgi:hypothetical protein
MKPPEKKVVEIALRLIAAHCGKPVANVGNGLDFGAEKPVREFDTAIGVPRPN